MSAGFFCPKLVAEARRIGEVDVLVQSDIDFLDIMAKLHNDNNCLSIDATMSTNDVEIIQQHINGLLQFSNEPTLRHLCTTLAGYIHLTERVARDYGIGSIKIGILGTQLLEEGFTVLRNFVPKTPPSIQFLEFFLYRFKFMEYGE